jgi:hypothetical protein
MPAVIQVEDMKTIYKKNFVKDSYHIWLRTKLMESADHKRANLSKNAFKIAVYRLC